jgi:TRAP-type C4-dicarboxylate transport system permease small subunit
MNRLILTAEKVSQVAAWGAGLILLLASIMIAVEVVLRKAFAISIGGADELSSYALAISCTWGFSFALFRKSHIRIDVLYNHLPRYGRFSLDILANVLLLLYIAMLSYFAFIVVSTSITKHSAANTPLATPLWIPQGLWLTGLIWFGTTIFLIIAGTIYYLAKKDHASASKLSGISTLSDEIEETTKLQGSDDQLHRNGGNTP